MIVETENHEITVDDVKTSYKAYRLWADGNHDSSEYYLIENRQRSGYDIALPGDGLLVWHVDEQVVSNKDEGHPKVCLVQADSLDQLKAKDSNGGDAGDPFPGSAKNICFNSISKPSSKGYSGQDTYVAINNIPPSSPSMTLNIAVKLFDPRMWYRITNSVAEYSLDIVNDDTRSGGLKMAATGNYSGQFWQAVSNGEGTYKLRSLFLGPNRCLDVYGNDKTKPHMAVSGDYSGQKWIIGAWGDGTWHLENTYSGKDMYLGTGEGSVALLAANPARVTQRWTFTPTRCITEKEFASIIGKVPSSDGVDEIYRRVRELE